VPVRDRDRGVVTPTVPASARAAVRLSPVTSILDSIDGALQDWKTSPDAMRWSPRLAEVKQRAVADAPPVTLRPGLSLAGAGEPWNAVGSGVFFSHPGTSWEELPSLSAGILRLADVSGPLSPGAVGRPAVTGTGLADLGRAIGEAFRPLLDWAKRMFHDLSRLLFPEQHRRCVTCHPSRKPKPLAVDGHEYQRRLKARRRGKR
jgi:hypothetical protein